jgi:hypothetical protein
MGGDQPLHLQPEWLQLEAELLAIAYRGLTPLCGVTFTFNETMGRVMVDSLAKLTDAAQWDTAPTSILTRIIADVHSALRRTQTLWAGAVLREHAPLA